MALAEFIRSHLERILAEWEAFARTRRPAADDMDREALRNAGSAIPPELQRTLYEPLMRARGAPQRHARSEGLGLGLYIAREIAKAHGGAIDVRSSAQAGTTFEVRLPRHVDPSSGVSGLT